MKEQYKKKHLTSKTTDKNSAIPEQLKENDLKNQAHAQSTCINNYAHCAHGPGIFKLVQE